MTTSVIRFALATSAFTAALIGCTPLEKKSAIRDTVTKEPDAAFLKRVKNDPFPAAGQAPPTTPLKASEIPTTVANSRLPIGTGQRAGVLGQTNITAGGSGSVNPTALARTAATASDATAVASDETPPPATPAATPTGTASASAIRPLTASRNNIRPLNRPLNGATRRN